MNEKVEFVENSQIAFKGTVNGIIGSYIYNVIIAVFFSILASTIIAGQNPNIAQDELSVLSEDYYINHFSVFATILGSIVTLITSIVIMKFSKFKKLCKKAINSKTILYGVAGFFSIIIFQLIFNIFHSLIGLDSSGNSNQDSVVSLILNSPFLGFMLVVILSPLVEEIIYRYFLFGGLRKKKKKWVAYGVASIIFMFMHSISSFTEYGFSEKLLTEFLYLPGYLTSGLILCYVYDKSENLGSSYIAHMINNLLAFLGAILL